MNQFLVQRYGERLATTAIEVQITAVSNAYPLPDDVNLRDKRVVGMFISDNAGTTNAPSGRPLVSNNAVKASFLTIKKTNDDVLDEFALGTLLQEQGHREIILFDFCSMNPQKSQIFVGNTSLISAGQSFLIQIIYIQ